MDTQVHVMWSSPCVAGVLQPRGQRGKVVGRWQDPDSLVDPPADAASEDTLSVAPLEGA